MTTSRRPVARIAFALITVSTSLLTVTGLTTPAQAATTYSAPLRTAVANLPTATERNTGYDRDLYKHWVDADKDGCDTRDEVLIAEAVTKPRVGSGCALSGGKWYSYYTKTYTTTPGSFDIDHMVPLAEAHGSGAYAWTASTRERFANDLTASRSLVAVTASSNRSKSDKDPAQWLPTYNQCRYVADWTATKIRWSLKVDTTEKAALVKKAKACSNVTLNVTKATVYKTTTTAAPAPAPSPTPAPATGSVKIARIDYDPAGSDTDANLNQELVVLTNPTSAAVTMTGWTLSDAANHTYRFGTFTLPAGASVQIHSGTGTNTATDLYAAWGFTWNNSGAETATLTRSDGTTAASVSYTGNSTGTVTF